MAAPPFPLGSGFSVREFWRYHFAGQALAGLGEAVWNEAASHVADSCVLVADALLAELEREPKAEGE